MNALILMDIQKEYITPERPFYLKGIEKSLSVCKAMLEHVRKQEWYIAHIRHISARSDVDIFQEGTEYSEFVAGFEPMEGESVFTKHDYSCFSNVDFCNWIDHKSNSSTRLYIAGYTTTFCINSTLEEAHRKNIKLTLVEDAALAKSIGNYSENEMHKMLVELWRVKGIADICLSKNLLI